MVYFELNPTNQASVQSSVVPVLPARSLRLMRDTDAAVPDTQVSLNMLDIRYAVDGLSALSIEARRAIHLVGKVEDSKNSIPGLRSDEGFLTVELLAPSFNPELVCRDPVSI